MKTYSRYRPDFDGYKQTNHRQRLNDVVYESDWAKPIGCYEELNLAKISTYLRRPSVDEGTIDFV